MTDHPTDGQPEGDPGEGEGPIKPEVVRRGAAARKRRMGVEGAVPGDAPAPVPGDARPGARRATGTLFRIACMLLTVVGALELFLGAQLVMDPDDARCTAARFRIDDANEDDESFNDVDLPEGAADADELGCEQAIAAAGDIPDDEDEPADGEFAAASSFRTQGMVVGALGLAHGVSGFLTLRTRNRRWRTAALVFVAIGLFLPVLGIVSLVVMAFVVFALVFSNDAKAIFGQPGGLFRPRVPRNPDAA